MYFGFTYLNADQLFTPYIQFSGILSIEHSLNRDLFYLFGSVDGRG